MFDIKIILRIILAVLCGAAIGYERVGRSKEAGIKTHVIAALCAVVVSTTSLYGLEDGGRLSASIISGFGFLGGNIIFVKNGGINGLTTAAGLWTTIGISVAIGLGRYDIGIAGTITLIFLQYILHKDFSILRGIKQKHIELSVSDSNIKTALQIFSDNNFGFQMTSLNKEDLENCKLEGEMFVESNISQEEIIRLFIENGKCKSVKII